MLISDGIHLTSTVSVKELHDFAASWGISRDRYEGWKKAHPHYDLPVWMKNPYMLFTAMGVLQVSSRAVLLAAQHIYFMEIATKQLEKEIRNDHKKQARKQA